MTGFSKEKLEAMILEDKVQLIAETLTINNAKICQGLSEDEIAFAHASLTFNVAANLAKNDSSKFEQMLNLLQDYLDAVASYVASGDYDTREMDEN